MNRQSEMELVFGPKIHMLPEDKFPSELQVINFMQCQLDSKSY